MNNIKTLVAVDKYKISDLKISDDTSEDSIKKICGRNEEYICGQKNPYFF